MNFVELQLFRSTVQYMSVT